MTSTTLFNFANAPSIGVVLYRYCYLDNVAGKSRPSGRRYSIDLLGAYRSSSRDRSLQPLPGAVAHFQRAMMMDVDQAAKAMRDEEMLAEIEDFLEGFNQPTYRGMRINGPGRYLVIRARVVRGWSARGGVAPMKRLTRFFRGSSLVPIHEKAPGWLLRS